MNLFRKAGDGTGNATCNSAKAEDGAAAAARNPADPTEDEDGEFADVPLDAGEAPSPPRNDDDDDDDYDDDDSDYTYETDDEEGEGLGGRGNGWFSFLRRGRKKEDREADDDEEDEDHDDSDDDDDDGDGGNEQEESEEEEEEEGENDSHGGSQSEGGDGEEDDGESSEESAPGHPLLRSPETVPAVPDPSVSKEEEEEEALLMAQAIRRVQDRIHSQGGNLYDALSEQDKKLVDSLRGVEDEGTIREAVARSMEGEEREKGGGGVAEGGVAGEEESKIGEETPNGEVVAGEAKNEAKGQGGDAATASPLQLGSSLNAEPSFPADANDFASETKLQVEQPSLAESPGPNDTSKVADKSHPPAPAEEILHVDANGGAKLTTEHPREETECGEEDEDEEDEPLTVEERRSLLALAAEHDRVDVIRELLDGAGPLSGALLHGEAPPDGADGAPSSFSPPPLHVAVAHGSVHAASCLLRMGANPCARPDVPSGGIVEEGRNYGKYHGTSAWELAFGGVVDVGAEGGDYADGASAEGGEAKKDGGGGWFGFGSPKKEVEEGSRDNSADDAGASGKKRRIKKKLPLNIPPQKLEGIKHAFTAEALRAIGSDEAHRLQQLLDAGMDSSMEVAGKTIEAWAKEMDAVACCELLGSGTEEKEAPSQEINAYGGQEEINANDTHVVEECIGPNTGGSQTNSPAIQDERLAGLSLADIQTLVRENESLLPHLTACRDDLAKELASCQSILRDVQATGGQGGLSSRSLLDQVRALKDQRAAAEEAAQAWRQAWEEREDELAFLWEEVLDDSDRAALDGVLDGVLDEAGADVVDAAGDWSRRFIEADARISALRTSIAALAEENAKYVSEIERNGMSGALSLTRSLRDEVKDFETNLNVAMSGEAECRKKIDIIQSRLGHGDGRGESLLQQQGHYIDENHAPAYREDDGMEKYQSRAIVPQQQHPRQELNGEERSNLPPTSPIEIRPEPPVPDIDLPDVQEHDDSLTAQSQDQTTQEPLNETIYPSDEYEDETSGVGETKDIVENNDNDGDEILELEELVKKEETPSEPNIPTPNANGASNNSVGHSELNGGVGLVAQSKDEQHQPVAKNPQTTLKKPSDVIAEGMSTAIVVHSPAQEAGSLPSQIWEILKRIVGLGRVPPVSASSESFCGGAPNHPHIMIV